MKILLIGSEGQLGSELKPMLEAAGGEVTAPRLSELDITDGTAVAKAVEKISPNVIINCAAYTAVDRAENESGLAAAINKTGAANLAMAAADAGAILIHISTDFVFDGCRPVPYMETDLANPLGAYGASKLEGEQEVSRLLDEHIIVRTSWLYGAGGHNFVKTMLRLAAEKESISVVYDQTGTPTWTADLAGAIVEIVRSVEEGGQHWGVYHYSNEGVASWYDFAVAIIEEAREAGFAIKCGNVLPVLTAEYPTPAKRPPYSVLDKAKIKRIFNLRIPHWRASLREMLKGLDGGGHA